MTDSATPTVRRHDAESNDPRVIRTRQRISKAFHNLLDEQPVDTITVSAVAKRAGINRKTFYLHYSSIDDLIERDAETIANQLAQAILETQQASSNDLSPVPFFREMALLVQHRPSVYRRVFHELSLNRLLDLLSTPLENVLTEGGDLTKPEDVRSMKFLIRYCTAGTLAIYLKHFEEDETPSTDEIIAVVDNACRLFENRPVGKSRQDPE